MVDGALSIERSGIQLVSLGRGEWVGEFALIDGGPHSGSAIAETDVFMLKWMREDFDTTISKNRAVVYGLFKILTGRLRGENNIRVEVVLEKERWRQDLKPAHEIQMGMLPKADLITDHTEISGNCRPATDVGGDYYDYLLLEDDAPSQPPLVQTVTTRPPVRRRGFGSEILSTVAVRGENAVTSPTSIWSPTGNCPT